MTKTKAREWLKAVRKVSENYKSRAGISCPLCDVTAGRGCDECLWLIFSGIQCRDHLAKTTGFQFWRQAKMNPRWVRLSMARLKRWEKRLLEIIETQKEDE